MATRKMALAKIAISVQPRLAGLLCRAAEIRVLADTAEVASNEIGDSAAALLLGAASLEALFNELLLDLTSERRPLPEVSGSRGLKSLKRLKDDPLLQKGPTLQRYDRLSAILNLQGVPQDRDPYPKAALLFELRNRIMHYRPRPELISLEPEKPEQWQRRFLSVTGLTAPSDGRAIMPNLVLSHACAKVLVNACRDYAKLFCSELGVANPLKVDHSYLTHIVRDGECDD